MWPGCAKAGLLAAFPHVLLWVKHVNKLVDKRGFGEGNRFVKQGVVVKHVSVYFDFPGDTDFGSIKVSSPV